VRSIAVIPVGNPTFNAEPALKGVEAPVGAELVVDPGATLVVAPAGVVVAEVTGGMLPETIWAADEEPD